VTDDHCLVSRGCIAGCRGGGNRETQGQPIEITNSTQSQASQSDSSSRLKGWQWALIGVGVVLAFFVLFAVVFVAYRMKRTAHETV
jgi:hypothetical protein